ncbi:MAG TPA: selenocysteine-specific translation elongation factor [Roseiflexaceae bacterium]|nr:selenocysteine-specific translation elongation factor [Roseiflexaceae bacterium]
MYVIGTAGHVDHGKSTLVKTLTGIDPDRWEEEQRREMTIDLGFAWLQLPSGRVVSVIDVPGHERFIKNMLAGVGGIDPALLIIAADESVMPQTEEHLAILDLLGVRGGLVVLTKADLVDAEWLGLVREDVGERLRQTSFADAPIVAVSARSGAGLAELLEVLDAQIDRLPTRADARGAPRMSIDRTFTIGGFGTVVTGTLLDGRLRVGDELEILPGGARARVRGLQTHQQKVESALPGTRVAVNLAGISHHDLARGDLLALPGQLRPTERIDVQLRVISGATRPIVQNARLDLFVGAAEVACRITLLDRDELLPGEESWAQLRLERPIAVMRGDRYVVRLPSPSETLGGGRILDPHPARHRRFRAEVSAALAALARGTPADLLLQTLADGRPQPFEQLLRTSGLDASTAAAAGQQLCEAQQLVPLALDAAGTPTWLIATAGWERLHQALRQHVGDYHTRFPLRATMPREELRSRLALSAAAFDVVITVLSGHGVLGNAGSGIRLSGFQPAPTPAQRDQIDAWLAACRSTPYSPPAPEFAPDLQAWLIEQGLVVRIAPDILFTDSAYTEMLAWVNRQLEQHGSLTVAQFRDRFGSSRKYALAVLEYLDARRITRRDGDSRVAYAADRSAYAGPE